MMPGIRSFGRVRASPALESASLLRPGLPSSIDLRRQHQALQQAQAQQQTQAYQQSPGQAPPLRNDADRASLTARLGQREKPQVQASAVPQPHPGQGSISESFSAGSSSGSEHEPSSDCLADLVTNFMEVEEELVRVQGIGGAGSLGDEEDESSPAGLLELSSSIQAMSSATSPLEARVYSDVLCAIKLARSTTSLLNQDTEAPDAPAGAGIKRAVMSRLRTMGYNAAVCKSRWDHSRGFPGGDYEYLDVLFPTDSIPRERLVVDLDFRAQFQVARPTPHFEVALQAAPAVFVGRVDRLQQLVELLSDACRRSLRMQGLHLPPWRKAEYLRAKWLAPYKRTTNALTVATVASSSLTSGGVPGVSLHRAQQIQSADPAIPQLNFGVWPEAAQTARTCQPVQRHRPAQKGVLGLLLREQVVGAPPIL